MNQLTNSTPYIYCAFISSKQPRKHIFLQEHLAKMGISCEQRQLKGKIKFVSTSYVKSHINPTSHKSTQQALFYTSKCKIIQLLSAASTAKNARPVLSGDTSKKESTRKKMVYAQIGAEMKLPNCWYFDDTLIYSLLPPGASGQPAWDSFKFRKYWWASNRHWKYCVLLWWMQYISGWRRELDLAWHRLLWQRRWKEPGGSQQE